MEVLGCLLKTEGKHRLPACVDTRADVYETEGAYTVYQLALENENYFLNYGMFANGLLVETVSKHFLKDLSGLQVKE